MNKEEMNKEDMNKEEMNKEDMNKEEMNKEDMNKEDMNKEEDMSSQMKESRQLRASRTFPHNPLLLLLIFFTAVFLILTMALTGRAGRGGGGLFQSSISNQSAKYYLSVTPASWTFSIWGFIFTFHVLFMVIAIVAIFRKGPEGRLYLSPPIFPRRLFVGYNLINIFQLVWIFTFDRDFVVAAFVALFSTSVACYFTLGVSIWALHVHRGKIHRQFRWTGVVVRLIIHNGVGMYAAWTTIATLLNFAIVLRYADGTGVQEATSCTVILSILLVEILVFAVADIVFLDKFLRHVFTPYITFVVALIGSLSNNKDELVDDEMRDRSARTPLNRRFTLVLLILSCLIFVAKIVASIWRERRKPVISNFAVRDSQR